MSVRLPAGAGRLYPRDPAELAGRVNDHLDAAQQARGQWSPPGPLRALLVPHHGMAWCGRLQALGYLDVAPDVSRVVLLGAAHVDPFEGIATCPATAWATPLGPVPAGAASELAGRPEVVLRADVFLRDTSLEVQLPWLQNRVEHLQIFPLLVGQAGVEEVVAVLEQLWRGPDTLLVVCASLSRRADREGAEECDARTLAALACGQPADDAHSCAPVALAAVARLAAARGLRGEVLGSSTSAETTRQDRGVTGFGVLGWYGTDGSGAGGAGTDGSGAGGQA